MSSSLHASLRRTSHRCLRITTWISSILCFPSTRGVGRGPRGAPKKRSGESMKLRQERRKPRYALRRPKGARAKPRGKPKRPREALRKPTDGLRKPKRALEQPKDEPERPKGAGAKPRTRGTPKRVTTTPRRSTARRASGCGPPAGPRSGVGTPDLGHGRHLEARLRPPCANAQGAEGSLLARWTLKPNALTARSR